MNSQDAETLRAKKDFWFACVDIEVIRDKELSQSAKFIFAVLCTFVSVNNRRCWPSNDAVAKAAGVSKSTVMRAYKELEARGVIARADRFTENAQASSYTRIVGHNADCYNGVADMTPPVITDETPPVAPMTHRKKQENDNNNSLTREAELPSFTDMPPLAFENGELVIPDDKPLSKPEEICTPDDAPEIMKATAEYLLLKTGRKNLTWSEISALREMAVTQYPSRVQKEIDKACDRFKRKGRKLRTLSFCYIAGSLQHQPTRSITGRAISKIKSKPEHAELAPSTETFTEDEIAELEARVQGGRQNA